MLGVKSWMQSEDNNTKNVSTIEKDWTVLPFVRASFLDVGNLRVLKARVAGF